MAKAYLIKCQYLTETPLKSLNLLANEIFKPFILAVVKKQPVLKFKPLTFTCGVCSQFFIIN